MTDLLKKFWPDILAVLVFIADYTVKRLNDYAASHEHGTILVLLIAVVAAWHSHMTGGGGVNPLSPSQRKSSMGAGGSANTGKAA